MLFALENAQDYFRGRTDDLDAVGVRALDDRTVEFRLGGAGSLLPEHGQPPRRGAAAAACDRGARRRLDGSRRTSSSSGAFTLVEAIRATVSCSTGARAHGPRMGNVRSRRARSLRPTTLRRRVRGRPGRRRLGLGVGAECGRDRRQSGSRPPPAAGGRYSTGSFSTTSTRHRPARGAAGARPRDRRLRARVARSQCNVLAPRGGLVPPMLQGHTPDIAPRTSPSSRGTRSTSGLADGCALGCRGSDRASRSRWSVASRRRCGSETLGIEVGTSAREEAVDRVTRLVSGLPGSRVLPPAPPPQRSAGQRSAISDTHRTTS